MGLQGIETVPKGSRNTSRVWESASDPADGSDGVSDPVRERFW